MRRAMDRIRRALRALDPGALEGVAAGDSTAAAAGWLLGGPRPALLPLDAPRARRLALRAALLHFDHEAASALTERLDDTLEDRILGGWGALWDGRAPSGSFEALASRARADKRGDLVVEASALRALEAVERGALEDALAVGRRACRMGRAEELPMPALLANVVLARVRRLGSQPLQAAHILHTVRRFAPSPWRRWIDWELALCGRPDPDDSSPPPPPDRAPAGFALAARDRSRIAQALGEAPLEDAAIARWARGDDDDVPWGLVGFSDRGVTAYAVGGGDERPRRFLGAARPSLQTRGVEFVARRKRRDGRTDRVLAALLLAGAQGLDAPGLFRRGYGAVYVEELHRGVVDVQLHRCRAALGDAATIVRAGDRVRLSAPEPLAVADPRGNRRGDERVLQLLGSRDRLDAAATAGALGMSRRAAASALKELAAEGFCRVERVGRGQLVYRVEDTTFHTPTQKRVPSLE